MEAYRGPRGKWFDGLPREGADADAPRFLLKDCSSPRPHLHRHTKTAIAETDGREGDWKSDGRSWGRFRCRLDPSARKKSDLSAKRRVCSRGVFPALKLHSTDTGERRFIAASFGLPTKSPATSSSSFYDPTRADASCKFVLQNLDLCYSVVQTCRVDLVPQTGVSESKTLSYTTPMNATCIMDCRPQTTQQCSSG